MTTGTVKWFNPIKGYGFIEPEDGSKDAFVHISAVVRSGLTTLNEEQKVQYELAPGQGGKSSAENLVDLSSGEGAAPAAEEASGGDAPGESADTDDAGDDAGDESGEDAEVIE